MVYQTQSVNETNQLAAKIASQTKGGDILGLSGELGSGKTTFAKGFCQYFGVKEIITSPTFVVMKNYRLPQAVGKIWEIVHIDSYRINEIESIGLAEYLNRDDVVILIEWPEMIEQFLPATFKKIWLFNVEENTRRIETDIV